MNQKTNKQRFYVGNRVFNSKHAFFSPSVPKSQTFSEDQQNALGFKILINLPEFLTVKLKAICPMLWRSHATTRLQYQPVVVKSGFYL
jgi:hypothetical protein